LVCSSQNRGSFAHHFQKEESPGRVLLVEYQKIEYVGKVPRRIPAILPLERRINGLPFHELLPQSGGFCATETFCEEVGIFRAYLYEVNFPLTYMFQEPVIFYGIVLQGGCHLSWFQLPQSKCASVVFRHFDV
jgi:hypothetical protein